MAIEINTLMKAFERAGLEQSKATPDDAKFNFTAPHSNVIGVDSGDNEYQGVDTPPPPEDEEII